jgi:hypothetical protein
MSRANIEAQTKAAEDTIAATKERLKGLRKALRQINKAQSTVEEVLGVGAGD